MSCDLNVFIEKSKLPTKDMWLKEINDCGFNLEFNCDFDPDTLQGFLPCKLEGKDVGFEYYNDILEDTMFSQEDTPEIEGKDICIGFSSSFEKGNVSSAMILASTLVKLANGVFWMVDSFQLEEDPIEMARHIVEHGFE